MSAPFHPLARLATAAAFAATLTAGAALADEPAPAAADTAGAASTKAAPTKTSEPKADAAKADVAYDAQTVVAVVNGSKITLGELIMVRASLPQQYQNIPNKVLLDGILTQVINETLLEQTAVKEKFDKRPTIVLGLASQRRSFLAENLMGERIHSALTDDMLQAEYKKTYLDADPVEERHARHILVKERKQADAIYKQLQDGADFAKLAKKNGTDGTKERGGDLGWFVRTDMVPAFSDAVFAMKPGDISKPVKSPFGWHVIKLEGVRSKAPPAFKKVKAEISKKLGAKIAKAEVKKLADAAKIERKIGDLPADAIANVDLIAPH